VSFRLRIWVFAVAFLFVAEDFHCLLKIGSHLVVAQQTENPDSPCDDCNEENEAKGETEEEQKEKEEKDETTNNRSDDLLYNYSRLITNKFRDAVYLLSDIAHELESPPPEV